MSEEDRPTVRVAQGLVRGRRVDSRAGGSYLSFQGLPYAKPPLGPLRFKPPQAPETWAGVRDALQEGPMCGQVDLLLRLPYQGSEDCLFLNVYTKELPSPSSSVKLPVMVYIHGGAFVCGSGDTTLFGPDYLVEKAVVLVTINYRLGPMGFLSLPEASVPGNNGLKDQVAALRWVQQNIAAFGGDPGNVTIFGESAGAASVEYHMLSPMSKGLFHKAIAQSGCVLNPWAFCTTSQTRDRAFRLGEILGCSTEDPQELLTFLRSASVQELAEATTKVLTEKVKRGATMTPFLPVNEDGKSDDDVFLPDHPYKLLQRGPISDVPFMTGLTSHEGILFVEDMLKDSSKMKEIDEHFKDYLSHEVKSGDINEISKKVKNFYFHGSRITKNHLLEYVDFMSDTWFLIGIQRSLTLLAAKKTCPIFYYHFCFDGELNVYKKYLGASSLPGATHIDDLGYLFTMTFMDIAAKPKSKTLKTLERMVKMWTNFAKLGSPTAILDEDVTVQWTPYTSKQPVYLDIDTEMSMKENLMEDRFNLWNTL